FFPLQLYQIANRLTPLSIFYFSLFFLLSFCIFIYLMSLKMNTFSINFITILSIFLSLFRYILFELYYFYKVIPLIFVVYFTIHFHNFMYCFCIYIPLYLY